MEKSVAADARHFWRENDGKVVPRWGSTLFLGVSFLRSFFLGRDSIDNSWTFFACGQECLEEMTMHIVHTRPNCYESDYNVDSSLSMQSFLQHMPEFDLRLCKRDQLKGGRLLKTSLVYICKYLEAAERFICLECRIKFLIVRPLRLWGTCASASGHIADAQITDRQNVDVWCFESDILCIVLTPPDSPPRASGSHHRC
jgi:hypothetical protein